jgi:hypothetical protein
MKKLIIALALAFAVIGGAVAISAPTVAEACQNGNF